MIQMVHRMRDEQFDRFNLGYLVGGFGFKSALPVQAIDAVRTSFPKITIQVSEHTHDELIDLLLQGNLHAAYSINSQPNDHIQSYLLDTEPHYALISCQNALSYRDLLTLNDLYNEPMLVSDEHPLPEVFTDMLQSFHLSIQHMSGSFYHLIEHVRMNHGYSLAGRAFFMNFNLTGLVLIPITDLPPIRHELLVYRDSATLPTPAMQIIDSLRKSAGE